MTGRSPSQHAEGAMDVVFLGLVVALAAFGFIMLLSASGPAGYERFHDSFYFAKHQLAYGLLPGLLGLFVLSRIPYMFWKRHAWELLLVSVGLLVLVFIPGVGTTLGKGAHSWISIGGFFTLQPAELAKMTFLFYLAAWLETRGERGVRDTHAGFIPFVSVLGLIMLLMYLQPDVGTMSIMVAMALAVYFVGGASLWHLGLLGAAGVGLFALLIKVAPYRAARFMTFLHPEWDPKGVGYHINQALLAIGSGGLFGLGYGHSRQKFQYLPEVAGDSIFAVIAEEMGFFVATALLVLFLLLLYRGLRIAAAAPDAFGRYVVIGTLSWIVIQAFVNIGSMAGVLPMTGVTLPFVSYGGTSLAVTLASVGVVLNISRYGKKTAS